MTAPPVDAQRLRELLAAATPGPWTLGDGDPESILSEYTWHCVAQVNTSLTDKGGHNAALITEAINALPGLLALARAVNGAEDASDTLLNRLEGWGKAYPVDMFGEVTDEEREWLHATRPGLMDRIAASMGRHMAGCIADDLKALRAAMSPAAVDEETGNG